MNERRQRGCPRGTRINKSGRCFGCGIVAGTQRFSLAHRRIVDGRTERHFAGSLFLCEQCWRDATGRRKERHVPAATSRGTVEGEAVRQPDPTGPVHHRPRDDAGQLDGRPDRDRAGRGRRRRRDAVARPGAVLSGGLQ